MIAGYTTFSIFVLGFVICAGGFPTTVVQLNGETVMEATYGDDVVITCRSNDDDHNFLYWNLLDKNIIISATNEYDRGKFKFGILSGNLTVRSVDKDDEGLYICVSSGIRKDDFNIQRTRLVVQKEWEEVYEHDSSVNFYRIIILIAVLAILAMGAYMLYRMWRDRYHYPNYLEEVDEDDEDSGEEIYRAGPSGTSGSSSSKNGNIVKENVQFENPNISTDFSSILDTVNSK